VKKTILVIGASRGIGAEIVEYFSKLDYKIIGVSRSFAPNCTWIQSDISTAKGIEDLILQLENTVIDRMIFSSGIWETHGFMESFDFRKTSDKETRSIMSVNVIAPIEITKALSKNMSLSSNPRAIYLGALSGIDHRASSQVAYTASKFALRGAIQALHLALQEEGIGFTTINPGNVATQEVLLDIKEGRFKEQTPIPISDIISSIEWIFSLSTAVNIEEVNLSQKLISKSD